MDKLGSMMLSSPKFEDKTGYFTGKGIETEFFALNESLKLLRKSLGERRYHQLITLSDEMREYFSADPNDENGEAIKGREVILKMERLLGK